MLLDRPIGLPLRCVVEFNPGEDGTEIMRLLHAKEIRDAADGAMEGRAGGSGEIRCERETFRKADSPVAPFGIWRMPDDNHSEQPGEPANHPFDEFPIVYSYSRKQAIEDGGQIDVSTVAKEAGFRFPVFMTRGVWEQYVRVPEGISDQDEAGRLWDILWMLKFQARRSEGSTIRFQVHVRNEEAGGPTLVTLKSICGPRDLDDPSPAITILLLDED